MKALPKTDLRGCDGRTISSVLWRNKENSGSEKIAVILPGNMYPSEGPITFYLKTLFIKYGYDVFSIDYRYYENKAFLALNDEKKEEYFHKDIEAIFDYLKKEFSGKSIVFIGKSMGTTVLYQMANENIKSEIIQNSAFFWLTPAIRNKEIVDLCLENKLNSYYAIGDKDPYYSPEIAKIDDTDTFKSMIIPGAGHVFEKDNDLDVSISNLKMFILWAEQIIKKEGL